VVHPDLQCGLGDKVLLWQHDANHSSSPPPSLSHVIENTAMLEDIAMRLRRLSAEEAEVMRQSEDYEDSKAGLFSYINNDQYTVYRMHNIQIA
jgi:hypothetical protein